jgi:hypothetical protein
MKSAVTNLMIAGLVFTGSVYAAEPTNFDELKAYVKKANGSYDSYKMDVTISMNMMGAGMTYTGKIAGKGEQLKMDMAMAFFGRTMKMSMIRDADEALYLVADGPGGKEAARLDLNVVKEKAADMGVPETVLIGELVGEIDSLRHLLDELGQVLDEFDENYDVTFEGKEELDDVEVYVVTAKLNDELVAKESGNLIFQMLNGMNSPITVYVGAKDGYVRKTVQGKPERPFGEITIKNLELNSDLPDDTFVFVAPPGTQVQDITEQMISQLGDL